MMSLLPDESVERLRNQFGAKFERLTPLEVQALVTADLEKEAHRYASLEARGFIRPVKNSPGANRESQGALATSVNFERNDSAAQKADGEAENVAAASAFSTVSAREMIAGFGEIRVERADFFGLVEDFGFQSRTATVAKARKPGYDSLGKGVTPKKPTKKKTPKKPTKKHP